MGREGGVAGLSVGGAIVIAGIASQSSGAGSSGSSSHRRSVDSHRRGVASKVASGGVKKGRCG